MTDILNALKILFKTRGESDYIEFRALRASGPPRIGYYNDLEKCAEAVADLDSDGGYRGIYVALNGRVADPGFRNTSKVGAGSLQDSDIEQYHWFWVDFDSIREDVKQSATDEELDTTRVAVFNTLKYLREQGWPVPLIAMSGNGYHLAWRVNVPVTPESITAYQDALHVLKDRFYEGIDTKIFNPSRICRLYGTTARKGEDTLFQPHRVSRILNAEIDFETLDWARVEDLAAQKITEEDGEETDVKFAKLQAWLTEHYPQAAGPKQYMGGKKWVFEVCPWNDEHRDNSAFVVRFPSGAIVAGCLHTHCGGANRNEDGQLLGWSSLQEKAGEKLSSRRAPSGPSTGQSPGRTDLGNAKRMVNLYGADMRYVPEMGWLFWNGTRWEHDTDGKILRRAAGTAAAIFAQAAADPDPDESKLWRKWAEASESASRLKAMVELAGSEPGISVSVDHFDSDHWSLATTSGLVSLRAAQVVPVERGHYTTKVSPVAYDPNATCPKFDAFMARIFKGDQEMIDYVYRALGYSITGVCNEQVMFFAHGLGANGKSTLMSVVQYILGDYARMVDSNILMQSKGDQHTTGLTDLKGLRLAVASETDKSNHFSEATIKKITGEEKITARRMRQDNMTFTATHKLWMLTNHRPIIKGNDEGIWRRIVYVPFEVVIPKEERDPDLLNKLKEEASGILNRLLAGCREWQRRGLAPPAAARAQVAEYRHEMDQLAEFFEDYCLVDSKFQVTKQDLFEAYCQWCSERRQNTATYNYFNRLLKERGYRDSVGKTPDGKSVRKWHGVTLQAGIVISIGIDRESFRRGNE